MRPKQPHENAIRDIERPPIADIRRCRCDVRYVPEAEVDARDQAILRAMSGAMRQIEDELIEGRRS